MKIGRTLVGDQIVELTEKQRRATHSHILGTSGGGKTKLIEWIVRSDILANRGLCLIDPHGHLFTDLVEWCTAKGFLDREDKNIVLLDPSSDEYSFGFNPCALGEGADISFCVGSMIAAISQVWGGEDNTKTPLLKLSLNVMLYALIEKNLTLREVPYLIDHLDLEGIRRNITDDLQDPVYKDYWKTLNSLSPKAFREDFASTSRRIFDFVGSKRLRRIFGQNTNIINFRKMMDEGAIVLVNLAGAGKLHDEDARLLGTLIVNDLFLKARDRPLESRPFNLIIDECHLYLTNDVSRILSEARKFGLFVTLSHQLLSQLRSAGDVIYDAVTVNAKNKTIFGGLGFEEAEWMVRELYAGDTDRIDLERSKSSFDKPTVVDFKRTKLLSSGEGEGAFNAFGEATGYGSVEGSGLGHILSEAPDALPVLTDTTTRSATEVSTSSRFSR